MLVWILGGFYVWRKWEIFLSYLISFGALLYLGMYLLDGNKDLSFFLIYLDSTIYFIAAIMLTEPKTSPFLPWKQVTYGVLAAVILMSFNWLSLPYPELFAIVGANLFNAALKWAPAPQSSTNSLT